MEFVPFKKLARLSREICITEKIDGTNASIFIGEEDGTPVFRVGSRTRWITPEEDNFGFAKWAHANHEELLKLGAGHHFGEWWGQGIQRNYSLTERRFSLFNSARWGDAAVRPLCCHVVPLLYVGQMEDHGVLKGVKSALKQLEESGSAAAPGFMKPEGIVIYHTAANISFKKTLEKDDQPKGMKVPGDN